MTLFQNAVDTNASNGTFNIVARDQINIQIGEVREQRAEEYEATLRWLLPNDPLDTYWDILSRRQGEGVGDWLLKHPKFTGWLSTADKTLWCPGIAGAGKTMLATIVAEYLFGLHEQSKGSVGIACVYINYKEENQTLEKFLLSILKQLLQRRKVISEKVISIRKSYENDKAQQSTRKILEMLRCEVDSLMDTFIIVDALDECPHGMMFALLNELEKLQPKIHLLVTSRYLEIIAERLERSVKLEISAQSQDLQAFIKARIADPENYRLRDFVKLRPKLQKEIEDAVITTANGMFLLARLHIESIACRLSRYEVRKALKTLPTTVDDTYALALARIDNQPLDGHRNFSRKVLTWVAYSFRLLTVNELLCALAIDPGDLKFSKSKVPLIKDVTGLCAGLVIIDRISDVVRLVHPTMQTYFNTQAMRSDSRFSGTLAKMAEICLTYLSFGTSDGQDSPDDSDNDSDNVGLFKRNLPEVDGCDSTGGSHYLTGSTSPHADLHDSKNDGSHSPKSLAESITPLLNADPHDLDVRSETDPESSDIDDNASEASSDNLSGDDSQSTTYDLANALEHYAVRYWCEHARCHSEQSENCSTTLYATTFLCNDARREAFVHHMWYVKMYATFSKVTGLHIAAKFGLTALARALLTKGYDINALDGAGKSALVIAIESGQKEVANMLVDAGAFVDLLERSGHTMLITAAEKNFKGLVDRILQKPGGAPQIILLAAGDSSRYTQLTQILEHPDLDLKNKHIHFGTTALLLAVEHGNYKVIKLLLERGVDVNAAGGMGAASPALHRAAGRGSFKIVELLLKNKPNVNLKDAKGQTAWSYSVSKGQWKISELLRKAGADPNTKGKDGESVLYGAAAAGHLEIVKHMLESGTDPSIETDFGWTPLHWAANNGYYDIVKLLLRYGAKPSPLSDLDLTPLDKAQKSEKWEIVKLLQEAGAISGRNAPGKLEELKDSITLDDDHEDRLLVFQHQTHCLQNGDLVSLLPIITEAMGIVYIILAAILPTEGPGSINNDSEVYIHQGAGFKVIGVLGGAEAGSFSYVNDLKFKIYYSGQKDSIIACSLDGVVLDVEKTMSLNSIIQLIDRLKNIRQVTQCLVRSSYPDFMYFRHANQADFALVSRGLVSEV